ncbi:hypothetical protein LOZ57_001013 [Ophidiomyces ophidiicola]|uniref:uncharacterized protein n=1 Tax=Ophidiomyces ophidiicola TaxID=1387563 RepID=UPI0020C2FF75|nr:uncharacterized protein LOZ57_001013 [Ophidiomyces ophidiicola]KAI1952929.1 hypothetical protein LOZ57_001013 [Ophidiomyces ophidiicola]KAI2057576.1 hypothetical protein LOZ43_003039 [Ophidiomyces ophidiicola]
MPIKDQILGDSSDSKSDDTSENSTRCSPASSRETLTDEFEVKANNFRNEFHAYKMDQVSLVNLTNIQPQQSKESWPRMQPVHTELQGMDEDVVFLERWIAIRTKLFNRLLQCRKRLQPKFADGKYETLSYLYSLKDTMQLIHHDRPSRETFLCVAKFVAATLDRNEELEQTIESLVLQLADKGR